MTIKKVKAHLRKGKPVRSYVAVLNKFSPKKRSILKYIITKNKIKPEKLLRIKESSNYIHFLQTPIPRKKHNWFSKWITPTKMIRGFGKTKKIKDQDKPKWYNVKIHSILVKKPKKGKYAWK